MEAEQIQQNVKLVLPNISEECCKKLLEKLDDIGVETVDDLSIVQERDLTGILKPIQIRKLLTSWASVPAGILSFNCSSHIKMYYPGFSLIRFCSP